MSGRVQLKEYQQGALARLAEYLRECSQPPNTAGGEPSNPAAAAFERLTHRWTGRTIPYRMPAALRGLSGLPYVCLRVPTGGGKTLMACQAAGIAMREWLHAERAVVLWLAPSDAIVEQTLRALRDPLHPYRLELESIEGLGPAVTVKTVEEALSLSRADVDGQSVVIVGTIQSFRQEDTKGLRVYRRNPNLAPLFDNLPPDDAAKLLPGPEPGKPQFSLVNALASRRPIVIVDEAHNTRKPLSAETLARLRPACILEWTATPDGGENPSNVLHRVTAAELKREGMVKLPLFVRNRAAGEWPRLLAEAVDMRAGLEGVAKEEMQAGGAYLRPILLIQAESVARTKELRAHLEREMIPPVPPDQIKIATGDLDELSAVDDLQTPACPVRFILTVQKLREGWDCPFAYVLCSLLETRSATAIEQIIGRVLRMPGAAWKKFDALNNGYVFAVSPTPSALQEELTGALTSAFGLSRQEAGNELNDLDAPTLPLPVREPQTVQLEPAGAGLNAELVTAIAPTLAGRVTFDPALGTVTIHSPLTPSQREQAAVCIRSVEGRTEFTAAVARVAEMAASSFGGGGNAPTVSPAERQLDFFVPLLCVSEEQEVIPLDQTDVLNPDLDLESADAALPEFPTDEPPGAGLKIDVTARGELLIQREDSFVGEARLQTLRFGHERDWAMEKLISWLDWKIPHAEIEAHRMAGYLRRTLQGLVTERGLALKALNLRRYELRDALLERLAGLRKTTKKAAFDGLLLEDSPLTVGPTESGMNFARMDYRFVLPYAGTFRFKKHYFPQVGVLSTSGEEFDCAVFLDGLKEVRFWVRNVPRQRGAFSLPTSTDRFYPDFACQLEDGRTLAVEYKGANYYTANDAAEKRAIGAIWERRSNGRCLFVMPTARGFEEIEQKLRPV